MNLAEGTVVVVWGWRWWREEVFKLGGKVVDGKGGVGLLKRGKSSEVS